MNKHDLEFFSLFAIHHSNSEYNSVVGLLQYSNYRKHANKRKFEMSYKRPFLIKRNSNIVKIISC